VWWHSCHRQGPELFLRQPCCALPSIGSCPRVQTSQVLVSVSPCSRTLNMQMMQSCSLRMMFTSHWLSFLGTFDTAVSTVGLHMFWANAKIQNVVSGPSPPSCIISGHRVEAVCHLFTCLARQWRWFVGLLYARNSQKDKHSFSCYVPARLCLRYVESWCCKTPGLPCNELKMDTQHPLV